MPVKFQEHIEIIPIRKIGQISVKERRAQEREKPSIPGNANTGIPSITDTGPFDISSSQRLWAGLPDILQDLRSGKAEVHPVQELSPIGDTEVDQASQTVFDKTLQQVIEANKATTTTDGTGGSPDSLPSMPQGDPVSYSSSATSEVGRKTHIATGVVDISRHRDPPTDVTVGQPKSPQIHHSSRPDGYERVAADPPYLPGQVATNPDRNTALGNPSDGHTAPATQPNQEEMRTGRDRDTAPATPPAGAGDGAPHGSAGARIFNLCSGNSCCNFTCSLPWGGQGSDSASMDIPSGVVPRNNGVPPSTIGNTAPAL